MFPVSLFTCASGTLVSLINTLLIIDPNFASVPNTVWAFDFGLRPSSLPYSLCLCPPRFV